MVNRRGGNVPKPHLPFATLAKVVLNRTGAQARNEWGVREA
jgi:hypothetical protein